MTRGSPWPSISRLIRSMNRVPIALLSRCPAAGAEHHAIYFIEMAPHLHTGTLAIAFADRRNDAFMFLSMAATQITRQKALFQTTPRGVIACRRDDVVHPHEDDVLRGTPELAVQ